MPHPSTSEDFTKEDFTKQNSNLRLAFVAIAVHGIVCTINVLLFSQPVKILMITTLLFWLDCSIFSNCCYYSHAYLCSIGRTRKPISKSNPYAGITLKEIAVFGVIAIGQIIRGIPILFVLRDQNGGPYTYDVDRPLFLLLTEIGISIGIIGSLWLVFYLLQEQHRIEEKNQQRQQLTVRNL